MTSFHVKKSERGSMWKNKFIIMKNYSLWVSYHHSVLCPKKAFHRWRHKWCELTWFLKLYSIFHMPLVCYISIMVMIKWTYSWFSREFLLETLRIRFCTLHPIYHTWTCVCFYFTPLFHTLCPIKTTKCMLELLYMQNAYKTYEMILWQSPSPWVFRIHWKWMLPI